MRTNRVGNSGRSEHIYAQTGADLESVLHHLRRDNLGSTFALKIRSKLKVKKPGNRLYRISTELYIMCSCHVGYRTLPNPDLSPCAHKRASCSSCCTVRMRAPRFRRGSMFCASRWMPTCNDENNLQTRSYFEAMLLWPWDFQRNTITCNLIKKFLFTIIISHYL